MTGSKRLFNRRLSVQTRTSTQHFAICNTFSLQTGQMNRVFFCSFKAQRFNKCATSNQALKTELAEGKVGKKENLYKGFFFFIFCCCSTRCVIINLRRETVSLRIPVQKKNICENPGIVPFTCQLAHGENVARLITKLLYKDFASLQLSQLAQLKLCGSKGWIRSFGLV